MPDILQFPTVDGNHRPENVQGLHRRWPMQAFEFSKTLSINPVLTAARLVLPAVLDPSREAMDPVVDFLDCEGLAHVGIAGDRRW